MMHRRNLIKSVGTALAAGSAIGIGSKGVAAGSSDYIRCEVTEYNGVETYFWLSLDAGVILDPPSDWEVALDRIEGTLKDETKEFVIDPGYDGGIIRGMEIRAEESGTANVTYNPDHDNTCMDGYTGDGEFGLDEGNGGYVDYNIQTNAGMSGYPENESGDDDTGYIADGTLYSDDNDGYATRGYISYVGVLVEDQGSFQLNRRVFEGADC
jgi:hypothetical protein